MSLSEMNSLNPEYISNPFVQKELYDLIERIYFNDFTNQTSYENNSVNTYIDLNNSDKQSSTNHSSVSVSASSASSITTSSLSSINESDSSYKDAADYELQKLNLENFDKTQLKNQIKKLQIQRGIVGRKLSDIILQNSQAYSIELKRVSDFKQLLEDSFQICSISRRSLDMSQHLYILPTLKLIKKQIKKLHLINLLNVVQQLKAFSNSTNQIVDLINSKEYPSAINLCSKTEYTMVKYEHLKCIKGLKITIHEYYKVIEESLSNSLSKVCRKYDENLFGNIVSAYRQLNKLDVFFEKLNTNVLLSINTISTQTLINLIISRKFNNNNNNNNENISKMNSYVEELKQKDYSADLFNLIMVDDYKMSLIDLCSNLWYLMKNFYKMSIWIYKNYILEENELENDQTNQKLKPENCIEYGKKLNISLHKIWQDVQTKLSLYFRSMNFDHFKFDEFIDILVILNGFIEIGHEFCNKNSDCNIMILAVKDQTLAYFKWYHVLHLEELKMFLENETWQWCPVKADFSIFNLQEYKFVKEKPESSNNSTSIELMEKSLNENQSKILDKFEINQIMLKLIETNNSNSNINQIQSLFDTLKEKHQNDKNDKKEQDQAETNHLITNNQNNDDLTNHKTEKTTTSLSKEEVPILTNTTLNMIRLFGKYIHMLSIFKIISTQVISYLMQLFQFYFYYIYLDFTDQTTSASLSPNGVESITSTVNTFSNSVNNSFQSLIKEIKNDLFKNSKYNITEPKIDSLKTIRNREEYLCSMNQRIIAAESLIFLSKQLEDLFPLIQTYLPNKSNEINFEVYSRILKETSKLRGPIYLYIARTAIDYNQILESISKVNWDLDEILSQHNFYVDVLLRQIHELIIDVQSLSDQVPLNKKIINSILEETLKLVMKMLVDGYASVKKCSNEGRALMQLDFQQLIVKLEKICELRPIPEKEYVEAYIKAYYLPDSSIEKWVKDHTEYQPKHIASLLATMGQVTKKTRLTIMTSLGSNAATSIN